MWWNPSLLNWLLFINYPLLLLINLIRQTFYCIYSIAQVLAKLQPICNIADIFFYLASSNCSNPKKTYWVNLKIFFVMLFTLLHYHFCKKNKINAVFSTPNLILLYLSPFLVKNWIVARLWIFSCSDLVTMTPTVLWQLWFVHLINLLLIDKQAYLIFSIFVQWGSPLDSVCFSSYNLNKILILFFTNKTSFLGLG